MARLIDADKLEKEMYHEAFETDSDLQKWDSGCWIRYKMFRDCIVRQPTVDAVPVVSGEWLAAEDDWNYETTYECLICGFGIKTEQDAVFDWKYCPKCGAKMDGEKQ